MIDYSSLFALMKDTPLEGWTDALTAKTHELIYKSGHGEQDEWLKVLNQLPMLKASSIDLCADSIRVGHKTDCDAGTREVLSQLLRAMMPWRKGPFTLFGIDIDTEWRSDLKWNRLQARIQPLKDRLVLDVGCGSGYHCWRMGGEEARLVMGIDPTLRYVMQFQILQRYVKNPAVHVLPLNIDDVPDGLNAFDTVFSMGVLYHRRSPIDHLFKLKSCLREGGELVLETLVIDGPQGQVLVPEGRYAKMRNVWFIPSSLTLESWILRCGFKNICLVDQTQTSFEEQRKTEWMQFESLSDFLDPHDRSMTIEGYPAPKRAIFTATR